MSAWIYESLLVEGGPESQSVLGFSDPDLTFLAFSVVSVVAVPELGWRLFPEEWRYFWRCLVLVRTGVLNPGLLAEPEQSQGIYLLTTPCDLLGSYRI